MSDILYDEWMSESDSVLWHIERDPMLRSTITSVWLLDSRPDRERMDAMVERMVAKLPRLRQRVVDAQPGVSTPRWEDDPYFDWTYHYQWVRLAGQRQGMRDVLDYAQRLAVRSFDKDRPLWELTVIDKLPKKRAAFIMKVHHAIADGLGMVQMLQDMVDLEPDPAIDDEPSITTRSSTPTPAIWAVPAARPITHRISTEAKTGVRLGKASLRTASEMLRDPRGTIQQLRRTSGSIARVVTPAATPLSDLMTGRSTHTRLDTLSAPFKRLKSAANTQGGTLNDAFVAVALATLDRYHQELGVPCDEVRMNMPISVRGDDTATHSDNQFVPARMVLPLGHTDPARRLTDVKALLREVRAEPALPHIGDISGVVSRLGPAASVSLLGSMMKGVDITTTNVPGPPFPVWMAGARLDDFYAFGPLAGSAVNVALFTYDGTAYPGINLVTLLDVRGTEKSIAEKERFLPVVRFAVEQRLAGSQPDYWDHATMLELAVLDDDEDGAWDHHTDAVAVLRENWEPRTTAKNLRLIMDARKRREVDKPWLSELVEDLEERAG